MIDLKLKILIKVFWTIAFLFGPSLLSDSNKTIYHSKTWTIVDKQHISNSFQNKEVLIIGEEHNDQNGHGEKLELLKFLYSQFPYTISMEMFESDGQDILDEYISELIPEKTFLRDIRLWSNYQDYRPVVEFAKKNKLRIIAANTPSRYVKIVSQSGLNKLKELPENSFKFLPPLYTVEAFFQKAYQEKFYQTIQKHSGHFLGLENMFQAQQLWDASMSDAIAKQVLQGKKVIHINGRFHSDEFMGVSFRLKRMKIPIITISMFPLTKNVEIDNKFAKYADYIYITDRKEK
ncbi:MAG: ChaN family lipoprotein [Leptospiraceae bacterium]|nr:ChaN family lipoprotein [Leptospiraceae bacterium]MCP5495711.1 ChaN family lipoprotein [Leptospiraceae bacterium]